LKQTNDVLVGLEKADVQGETLREATGPTKALNFIAEIGSEPLSYPGINHADLFFGHAEMVDDVSLGIFGIGKKVFRPPHYTGQEPGGVKVRSMVAQKVRPNKVYEVVDGHHGGCPNVERKIVMGTMEHLNPPLWDGMPKQGKGVVWTDLPRDDLGSASFEMASHLLGFSK
jgi:hypothetical protein